MKKQEQLNLFQSPQSVYAPYLIECAGTDRKSEALRIERKNDHQSGI